MSLVPLELQYLVGASIIVVAVVLIAISWRSQRSMIVLSAVLAAPHALSALLLVPHYWRPRSVFLIGIAFEDILFMIGVGGMAWIFSASAVGNRLRVTLDPRRITKRYLVVLAGCAVAGFSLMGATFRMHRFQRAFQLPVPNLDFRRWRPWQWCILNVAPGMFIMVSPDRGAHPPGTLR